jgi:TPR repeat protein
MFSLKRFLLFTIIFSTSFTYAESFESLKKKAKKGDSKAQYELATSYLNAQDPILASVWLKRAIKQGNVEASILLSKLYIKGEGVKKDYKKAEDILIRIKNRSDAAKKVLARLYIDESIRNLDEEKLYIDKAVLLLRKLINKGDSESMVLLANIFLNKKTLVRDEVKEAFDLLVNASKLGDLKSIKTLADCFYVGHGCKKDYKKMLYYLKLAALQGDLESIGKLAYSYENGLGVAPDFKMAFTLHKEAAESGLPISQLKLGDYYLAGNFVKQSVKVAKEWYNKAATSNYPPAIYKLAMMADQRIGQEQNKPKAIELLTKAAKFGEVKAQLELAYRYKQGDDISQSNRKAFFWFEQAAMKNNPNAELELGIYYIKGIGVEKNKKLGYQYLKRSAVHGNKKAKLMMLNLINEK